MYFICANSSEFALLSFAHVVRMLRYDLPVIHPKQAQNGVNCACGVVWHGFVVFCFVNVRRCGKKRTAAPVWRFLASCGRQWGGVLFCGNIYGAYPYFFEKKIFFKRFFVFCCFFCKYLLWLLCFLCFVFSNKCPNIEKLPIFSIAVAFCSQLQQFVPLINFYSVVG